MEGKGFVREGEGGGGWRCGIMKKPIIISSSPMKLSYCRFTCS